MMKNPQARKEGLVVQETKEEVLVYDLRNNKAHCLNQTAGFVWKQCDGKNKVSDITNLLEKEYATKVTDELVWLAIDQLSKDNLLETVEVTPVTGMSRREVIKRVGIASLVALPIVTSLVAPTAVMAATSCTCPSGPGAGGNAECAGQAGCPAACGAGNICTAVAVP